jgi:formylglycine-generating enzyme required for sulfatase activity
MEKRVALVVGNGAYKNTNWLTNPAKDAEAIAQALKRLDFDVLEGCDLDFANLAGRIRDFGRALKDAHVALFFYAGHGLQVRGNNYVVPVDAALEHEADVHLELVAVQAILAQMEVGNRTSILILDACRDNPLARNLARAMGTARSIAVGNGLTRIQSGIGTYIAFATAPDEVASDGVGGSTHSPFTAALLTHIEELDLSIFELMMRVRQQVIASTQNSRTGPQVPWESHSLVAPFYFKRSTIAGLPERPRPDPGDPVNAVERDWERFKIAETDDVAVIKAFIDLYGKSEPLWADRARERLKVVEAVIEEREKDRLGKEAARYKTEGRIEIGAPFMNNTHARWFSPGAGKTEWFKDLDNGPEMVVLPSGKFMMGSPKDEPQRESLKEGMESPEHEVTIPKPFAIGRCAVTSGQFAAFVAATGHKMEGGAYVWTGKAWKEDPSKSWRDPGFTQDDSHPVVCVGWEDAEAYVTWLTRASGATYRLPSEAEWEYACRAGTTMPLWWGSSITPDQANYDGSADPCEGGGTKGQYRKGTVPAKSFEANPWGLYQVHGNVWEWCEDLWHDSHADKPENLKATGVAWTTGGNLRILSNVWEWCEDLWDDSHADKPENLKATGVPWTTGGNLRILRGGSWFNTSRHLRSAYRSRYFSVFRNSSLGFRVARTLTS